MSEKSSKSTKIFEGMTVVAAIAATWYVTCMVYEKHVSVADKQKDEAVAKLKAYEDLEKLGGIPQLIKELKTATISASTALKEKNAESLLEVARKDLSVAKSQVDALETKLTTAQAEASKLALTQNELKNSQGQNSVLSAENVRLKATLQAWEAALKELEEFTVETGATRLIFGNQIVIGVTSIYSSSASFTFDNQSVTSLNVGKYKEFTFGGSNYRLLLKRTSTRTFNSSDKESATFGIFPDSGMAKIK